MSTALEWAAVVVLVPGHMTFWLWCRRNGHRHEQPGKSRREDH